MNRRQRRALAKALSGALGRKGARPPTPDPVEERIQELQLENVRMRLQIDALGDKFDAVPGVEEGRKDWFVYVGGEKVSIKAIPPVEWVRSLEELPSFLFAFTLERLEKPGETLSDEKIAEIFVFARRWIEACAVDPESFDLDRLTLPEAQHAVAHIAVLNGVTDYLRAWFRRRLEGVAGDTPGGEELRRTPVEPPGDLPN